MSWLLKIDFNSLCILRRVARLLDFRLSSDPCSLLDSGLLLGEPMSSHSVIRSQFAFMIHISRSDLQAVTFFLIEVILVYCQGSFH